MPEQIRLSEKNQENINRISQIIDASGNALVNYIVDVGSHVFEEYFKKLDEEIQDSFRQALKGSKNKIKKPG